MAERTLQDRMERFVLAATVTLNPAEGVMDISAADFASGTLIRKGKRVFISTVAHYIESVSLSDMTVGFSGRDLTIVKDITAAQRLMDKADWSKLTTQVTKVKPLWHQCGTDLEDVAVIEIDPGMVTAPCWVYDVDEFVDKQVMPQVGELVLVAGVPTEDTVFKTTRPGTKDRIAGKALGRVAEVAHFPVQSVSDPEQWKDMQGNRRFFPEYHFAVKYPRPNRTPPVGLSGGGVWRANEGTTKTGLFLPYPVLVGVENNYNDVRDCVKATSVDRLLALLDGPKECARCKARGIV